MICEKKECIHACVTESLCCIVEKNSVWGNKKYYSATKKRKLSFILKKGGGINFNMCFASSVGNFLKNHTINLA